jgi:hypothetical protein
MSAFFSVALALPVSTAHSASGVSFAPHADYATFAGAVSVTTGDLNGDGNPDVVVGNEDFLTTNPQSVSVFLGQGDGTLGARVDYSSPYVPSAVALADLNGDGKLDLAYSTYSNGHVYGFLGNGDGTLGQRFNYPVGAALSRSLATGDLNGDGKLDLVTLGHNASGFVICSVLLGNGDGTFSTSTDINTGLSTSASWALAMADLNSDGRLDLVICTTEVYILLGNGDGTFQAPQDAGVAGRGAAIGDLNGDGIPDLAVATWSDSTVSVQLGLGNGQFGAPTYFRTRPYPNAVTIGDLNHDGAPDLVVACGGGGTAPVHDVSVLVGNGDGTFAASTNLATGGLGYSVAIVDLNHDHRPDLLVGCVPGGGGGVLSVLLNTTPIIGVAGGPLPAAFELSDVAPSPTGGIGRVHFSVPRDARVRLTLTDIQGRRVVTLADDVYKRGRYEVAWDGRIDGGRAPSGIYFVRLETSGASMVKKFVVAR